MSAKEHKRAQQSAKERLLLRQKFKQPGLKQPGLGTGQTTLKRPSGGNKEWGTDFYTPPVLAGGALFNSSAPALYKIQGP